MPDLPDRPDVVEPCPCRLAEPYGDTCDLETRAGQPVSPHRQHIRPGHALLELVSEWEITCRQCGVRWTGQPCPGWIYGDTVWRRQDPPPPQTTTTSTTMTTTAKKKTPRGGRRRTVTR